MSGTRWYVLFFVMAALIGASSAVFMSLAMPGRPQSPAVELLALDYEPANGCPGDVIEYGIKWKISRPSLLFVVSSHLRGLDAEGDTVLIGRMPNAGLTTIPTERFLEDSDAAFTIPDLPPGGYTRVLSIGTLSEDSKPAIVLQPYTVINDCPD